MAKNKRVIVLLCMLIGTIGVSLAYFVGKTIFSGTGATTEGRTATVNGSTLDISGNIEFKDIDIYPGHQALSKVTATATGNNELITYNLTWVGTNNLNTNLKYKVYVSEEEKEIELTCEKKKKVVNGAQQLNEVCTITGELGEPINEGEIPKTIEEEQTITITNTEFITSKETGEKKYYYIIVEYPDNGNQSEDIGEGFKGRVYGEISNTKADINLVAFYKETEEGKYEEVEDIPDNNYILNQEETKCNNEEVKVRIENNEIILSNVNKSGTACYLYFDILNNISPADRVVAMGKSKQVGQTNFMGVDKSDNSGKMYSGTDNDGTTYYFRGVVNDNWVRYGMTYDKKSIWWRIIRINGDGTIRLIYAGTTTLNSNIPPGTTGTGTQITVGGASTFCYGTSDCQYKNNKYVGYQYADSNVHGKLENSYVADRVNEWFRLNLEDEWNNGNGEIDKDAGFCADRNIATGHSEYTGNGIGTSKTVYMPADRFRTTNSNAWKTTQAPIFTCTNHEDLFTYTKATKGTQSLTYPVGLITADEVVYAGGFGGKDNNSYYLYTSSSYWTMSPASYDSRADEFQLYYSGTLNLDGVNSSKGVRPVINLKADTIFTGDGKSESPFVVQ